MNRKTLVLVDLQPYYLSETDHNYLIERTLKRVKKAKEKAESIVALYDDSPLIAKYGKIHNKLREAIPSLPLKGKSSWSGANEVLDLCLENKLPSNKFEIIGVNTHQCVADTALGLKGMGFPVVINNKYCGCACNPCYTGKQDKETRTLLEQGITVIHYGGKKMFWNVEFDDGRVVEVFATNEEEAMDVAEHEVNETRLGMMLIPVAVTLSKRSL